MANENVVIEKRYPEIGEKLYLQKCTGSYYVDLVKHPYTVVEVKGGSVFVQAARLVFYGDRYFDTLPDKIVADPNGEIIKLTWSKKHGKWQHKSSPDSKYPAFAHFGYWDYQPYLD